MTTWQKTKHRVEWFLNLLDSELVTVYQILFYFLVMVNGLLALVIDNTPPDALEETMNNFWYHVFLLGAIFGPVMLFLGKWLRGRFARAGAIFELVGDIGFCGVSTTWCVAIYSTAFFEKTLFATTYVLAAVICSAFFVIRDIRRLNDKERWVKV